MTTMKLIIITQFLGLLLIVKSIPISRLKDVDCGYQTCHPTKEGHINIHLVPHSHDDVGWVKTVDQYYYGVPVSNYVGAVQYIYQSVLDALKRSNDRRFIHVETAFFWKWWQLQDEITRADFADLVMSGQIEFIGGGWTMNDEAVTNYQSVIDQMTWGLRKLNDTFGECGRPKMGWQIDPFGHSSEMASIFAQLGYDGVILGRIDYEDKIARIANRAMDMVWRGSMSLGQSTDIFTSVLFDHYNAPERFCFEKSCNNTPIVDDSLSPEYNIDNRAKIFLEGYVHYAIKPYSSSNLLIPMGQDFAYENAEMWFMNMDKLIKYINGRDFNGQKYNVIYSTPSCYMYAVHKETEGVLTGDLKTDDFFPYASDKHAYWTGYYTSRPQLKRFERIGNNFLQVTKQLYSLAGISPDYEPDLNSLREAMGVMQHHDAITGTEKQVVANDYEKQLSQAITRCENITDEALSHLINKAHPTFEHCLLANISQCAYSERAETFVVTVYNPLSRHMSKYVRLPVWGTSYKVTDPSGNVLENQIMPIHSKILKIPGRTSNATIELIFQAENVPPLGFKSFYIQRQEGSNDVTSLDNGTFCVHYDKVGFDIDPDSGFVGKILFDNDVAIDLNQTFQFYCGAIDKVRPSGAYIFRRDPSISLASVANKVISNKLYMGPLVTEVHQIYSNMVGQTVRVYHNEKFVEFDWIVGSLPNFMVNGREVITKYSTQLKTKGAFYTDSNGRETLKRIRNSRPTWNVTILEPEPANYYPITSKITLRDEEENLQFTVLTDRAQGGASLQDGQIELMLHRNTQADDRLGVDEKLFDWAYSTGVVARGSHYVVAGHINPNSDDEENIVALEREISERKLLDSWTFISIPNEDNFEDYQLANRMEFYGLQTLLPANVHILTLEPWGDSRFLLRLEHTFAKDEDVELSQPVTVNLSELFTSFQIITVRETTLGGNQWLEENKRFVFKSTRQSDVGDYFYENSFTKDEFEVTLNPMQIRTFIVKTEPKLFYM